MSYSDCISHLASIANLSESLFRELSDLGLIAGGSVLSYLVGCKTSDIDLFLPEFKENDFERFEQVISVIDKYYAYEIVRKEGGFSVFTFERKVGNVHKSQKSAISIQIILQSESVEDILDDFDHDACRVGIHKGKFIYPEDAREAIDERACKTFGGYSKSSHPRSLKMIEKGFKMVYVPKLESFDEDVHDVVGYPQYLFPARFDYSSSVRVTNPVYTGYKYDGKKLWFEVQYKILNLESCLGKQSIRATLPVHLTLGSVNKAVIEPSWGVVDEYTYTRRLGDTLTAYCKSIFSKSELVLDGEEKLYEIEFLVVNGKLYGEILGELTDSYLATNLWFDFSDFETRVNKQTSLAALANKLKDLYDSIIGMNYEAELTDRLLKFFDL